MAVVVFDRSRRGGMLTCQHRLLSAMLARRHTARDRTAASRDVLASGFDRPNRRACSPAPARRGRRPSTPHRSDPTAPTDRTGSEHERSPSLGAQPGSPFLIGLAAARAAGLQERPQGERMSGHIGGPRQGAIRRTMVAPNAERGRRHHASGLIGRRNQPDGAPSCHSIVRRVQLHPPPRALSEPLDDRHVRRAATLADRQQPETSPRAFEFAEQAREKLGSRGCQADGQARSRRH